MRVCFSARAAVACIAAASSSPLLAQKAAPDPVALVDARYDRTAAVARASARYSPPMQLVGKLYRNKGGWTADWVFVDAGKVLAKWSVSDADARRAMASGADGTADALVKRYGKRGSAGPAGSVNRMSP